MKPFLLILSAPTGAGKTTIARALAERHPDSLSFSVSATTREPREGEVSGTHYHFMSPEEFQRRLEHRDFIEWAEYAGHLYGTPVAEVERILGSGRIVVLDIEVQGARQIWARRSDVVSVFVLPPSADILIERLERRGPVTRTDLRRRLEQAVQELNAAAEYDYVVVNDDREQAIRDVGAIVDAESLRGERVEAARELRDALIRRADRMSE